MTFHALAIDDDPAILDDVKDRLEGLGHTCDCVTCLQCAREYLAEKSYSYILLDLEIPVRYGRKSRIPNGQNLLREVRQMRGYGDIPIIVMTSHGHDTPDLAVEVLRCDGATDFVKKTFAASGHTLEKAIRDALATSGRSRLGAVKQSGLVTTESPQPFEYGEMVFSPSRVELCEVKICGGPESGMIRRILDELRKTNRHGRFVRRSGSELADLVKCERGQNGVAEAVAAFRTHVCGVMLDEASIKVNRLYDIILNDRTNGYRLASKITVRDADDPASPKPAATPRDLTAVQDAELNPRQQWAMEQMAKNTQLRKAEIVTEFRCSPTTAERDLRDLRRQGRVEFVGPAKTGHWIQAR